MAFFDAGLDSHVSGWFDLDQQIEIVFVHSSIVWGSLVNNAFEINIYLR